MTDREIMQQALDALELFCEHGTMDRPIERREALRQAIEQAELAKPEQAEYDKLTVKFGERAKEYLENAKKSWEPEPEPTAWVTDEFAITYTAEVAQRWRNKGWKVVPFYSAPPRKEWVGLTDTEVMHIYGGEWLNDMDFARAIEAKLKEKNT